jgi:hypothetical protein
MPIPTAFRMLSNTSPPLTEARLESEPATA